MDTPIPLDEHAAAAQREVQRWLGRCLIRLQQYERTIKEIVALHDVEFRSGTVETSLQSRRDIVAKKTLGQVVGSLFDTHVVAEGTEDPDDEEGSLIGGIALRMRIRLQLPRKDYESAKQDIADLVQLRNRLVHHFIEQHDLWTGTGCDNALTDLRTAYATIDERISQVVEWARWLDQSRQGAAAFLHSDEFHNAIVLGIFPDGTVAWPVAAVVEHLREAWRSLATDGWAAVDKAGEWVAARHPDLTPARHGCVGWRHVLHESRQFELHYILIDGRRLAHYRPRSDASSDPP